MTSTGTIMCADSSLADALGINAGDLVGRGFSNLCTDVEGVTRCGISRPTTCTIVGCLSWLSLQSQRRNHNAALI